MTDQRIIERMAEALLIVSDARSRNGRPSTTLPSTSAGMQCWVRGVLADPDEELAVAMLPYLMKRLDRRVEKATREARHD